MVYYGLLECLYNIYLEDNPVFLGKLCEIVLPHIREEDEPKLRHCLHDEIYRGKSSSSVRMFLDTLWSKAIPDHSNHTQFLKDMYMGIDHKNVEGIKFIESVIHAGIPRHINVMLNLLDASAIVHKMDIYTLSKLIECTISSNMAINKMNVFMHIIDENVSSLKIWYDERKFFSSQIPCESNQCQSFASKFNKDFVVSRILDKMIECEKISRPCEIQYAIAWLLSSICDVIETNFPDAKIEPILTGSAAECTQALYIDEFDYLMYTNLEYGYSFYRNFWNMLDIAIRQIKYNMYHPHLALKSMKLETMSRKYPCLYIAWVEKDFLHTHISIDLVPVIELTTSVNLPCHNYLPVKQNCQSDSEVASGQLSENETKHCHPLFSTQSILTTVPETVFSLIENELMKHLQKHMLEGYRVAKSVRIVQVIQPILPKLIHLGLTMNIHDLIRTYQLKTCVFYITQNYRYVESDIRINTRLAFAIAIYQKLREFIMIGNAKEFFATERFVFRQWNDYKVSECKHSEHDFTMVLPRFRCCRRRQARLLIVDQILQVLCDSHSKYHV